MDQARLDLERFAFPRQIVGAGAGDADGGEGRRRLEDLADEAGQQAFNLGGGRAPLRAGDDLPFGVVCRGFLAPAHAETVGLGPVLNDRHGLGRFPERDRQHAGGERIEGASVARLFGVEQELQPPDRLGRGDAGGLVEIDPAVDLDPGGALLPRLRAPALLGRLPGHSLPPPPLRSRATAGDFRSASMRAWASKLISSSKRRSGANLRLTRRAMSARSSFLWRSSAPRTAAASSPPSGITRMVANLRSGDMRTAGTVTGWRSNASSGASPRARMSASACRMSSPTRSSLWLGPCGLEMNRDIAHSLEARRAISSGFLNRRSASWARPLRVAWKNRAAPPRSAPRPDRARRSNASPRLPAPDGRTWRGVRRRRPTTRESDGAHRVGLSAPGHRRGLSLLPRSPAEMSEPFTSPSLI